jgi:Molecular chaperone
LRNWFKPEILGENLVHSCKKTLEEAKDKVEDVEKETIEKGIEELEEALKSDDKVLIDEKVKSLSEASAPLAQRLYEEESQKQADSSEDDDSKNDSEVVDADFEEVKEEKEQQNS